LCSSSGASAMRTTRERHSETSGGSAGHGRGGERRRPGRRPALWRDVVACLRAIFLAEELYETGVVALILRAAQRRERESAEPVSDVSPARARNHGH
jgi:hypothetical protein